jgi:uncharacterized membrane protein YccC
VLSLAFVLLACFLAMAITSAALRQWRPGLSAAALNIVTPQTLQQAAISSPVERPIDREQAARLKAKEAEDATRREAIRQREVAEAAIRRTAEQEARREREWQAYYKKPSNCDEAQPTIDSVGCANDYIRARRSFDEKFSNATR